MMKAKSILIVAGRELADRIDEIAGNGIEPEIISNPESLDQIVERVRERSPQIAILDIDMPGVDWITLMQRLKSRFGELSILVLAASLKKSEVLSAFRQGADGFLLKGSLQEQLVAALDAVKQGGVYMSQKINQLIRDHMIFLELGSAKNVTAIQNGISKLTAREKEVFVLLADGKSIKECAGVLGLSPKTVETHKYHIMEKLDFKTMADFTKLAMIKDLIPL